MSYQFTDDADFDTTYSKSYEDVSRQSNQSINYDDYPREPEEEEEDYEEIDTSPPQETTGEQVEDEGEVINASPSQSKVQEEEGEARSVEKVPSADVPPEEVDPTADIPVTIKDNIKYMSTAQIKAARYLQKKHIFELFNFLLGHLLGTTPSNPILFLDNLLGKCLAYRDGTEEEEEVEPPLVFTPQHIEQLYKVFDPMGTGSLTIDQYKTAMMSMGINDYNENPSEEEMGKVSQLTFCTEAERCLIIMLKEMLQVHRPCSMPALPVVALPSDADAEVDGEQTDVEVDGEQTDAEDSNLVAPDNTEEEYDDVTATSSGVLAAVSTDNEHVAPSPRGSDDVAAPPIDTDDGTFHPTDDLAAEHPTDDGTVHPTDDGTVHPTDDPAAEHGNTFEEEDPPLDQS